MDAHNQINDYFIISKEFNLKEDEEIEFFTYYDIVKKSNYILTIKDEKIYICMKLNQFGSVFYGNYVQEEPNTLIIKELDPILLMINVFYLTTKKEKSQYSFIDLNNIIHKYIELLNSEKKVEEQDIKSTQQVLSYLIDVYFKNRENLFDKICESQFNSFTEMNYYKVNMTKILTFLNEKVFLFFIFS